MDCHLLRTPKLPLYPLVGGTPITPIRTEELSRGELKATLQSPGVVPTLIIRITRLGVQRACALLRAASAMTSVVRGVARLIVDDQEVATLVTCVKPHTSETGVYYEARTSNIAFSI